MQEQDGRGQDETGQGGQGDGARGRAWEPVPGTPGAGTEDWAVAGSQVTPAGPVMTDLLQAARVVALAVLPVLVGLAALATAVGISGGFGDEGSLADWLRVAVLLLGLGLGARVVAQGSFDSSLATAGFDAGVRAAPLVVTVVVLAVLVGLSRRSEARSRSTGPGQLLLRAGLAGAVAGVSVFLLALVTRTSSAFGADLGQEFDAGGGVTVGLGLVGALLVPAVLVAVTVAAARWSVVRPWSPLPGPLGEVLVVSRVLRTAVTGLLLATGVLGVVGLLQQAVAGDLPDDDTLVGLVGALLVYLVNVLVVGALALLGVPVSLSAAGVGAFGGGDLAGSRADSVGLTDEPVLLLALLVPVLVVLATAVRRTVRGRQLPLTPRSVAVAAGVGVVGGLAVALLVRVWASGGGQGAAVFAGQAVGGGSASVGPSLLWSPLLGAAWAALAVAAVRTGPSLVLSSPSWLVRLVAGGHLHPQWAAAVRGEGPAPAGRRSGAVRGAVVGVGVLGVLAVVGVGTLAVVRATVLTPEAAVEDHLDALARGDVAQVLAGSGEGPEDTDVLLSPDVLDSGAYSPPEDLQLLGVTEYGSAGSAEVSYTVDGEPSTETLYLVREEGLLGGWTVEASTSSVFVDDSSGLALQVGGVDVAAGEHRALPGSYVFSPVEDDVLTADDVTVTTAGGFGFADVSVEPRVRDEVTDRVSQAVDAVLADCAARTEVPLTGCPFLDRYSYVPDDLTDLTVRVDQVPAWELVWDPYGQELSIVSDYDGEGVLTGLQPAYSFSSDQSPRPYEDTFGFSLDAVVTVTGDDVELEFSGY